MRVRVGTADLCKETLGVKVLNEDFLLSGVLLQCLEERVRQQVVLPAVQGQPVRLHRFQQPHHALRNWASLGIIRLLARIPGAPIFLNFQH